MPSLKVAQSITQAQALKPVRGWKPPSEAQRDAGNYKKYTFWWEGLHVSIENPKGSYRSGTDSKGKKWKTVMKNAYGYFKGTEGVDGDHLDVFVGPDLKSFMVYVVDQVDPSTGKFDEHKCVIGARSEEEARRIYLQNYQKGWKGLKAVKAFTVPEFKKWCSGAIDGPAKVAYWMGHVTGSKA